MDALERHVRGENDKTWQLNGFGGEESSAREAVGLLSILPSTT